METGFSILIQVAAMECKMADLRIGFLDVGHGDFIYATTPLGANLIIDVGTGDVVPSIFLSEISNISELQVSHPHTDHFDDIIAISKKNIASFRCPSLDGFTDDRIGWTKSDKAKIAKLRQMRREIAADNEAVTVGQEFDHTVWFPQNVDINDPNTASAVTTLAFKGVKILLGGDLPASGWKDLLNNSKFVGAITGTTIFKVPHHGRSEGCCNELFDVITPMLCVISDKSIEKDNKNTAATKWYSDRTTGCIVAGCKDKRKVVSTRSDGSIFIKINDKGEWWVHPGTCWLRD